MISGSRAWPGRSFACTCLCSVPDKGFSTARYTTLLSWLATAGRYPKHLRRRDSGRELQSEVGTWKGTFLVVDWIIIWPNFTFSSSPPSTRHPRRPHPRRRPLTHVHVPRAPVQFPILIGVPLPLPVTFFCAHLSIRDQLSLFFWTAISVSIFPPPVLVYLSDLVIHFSSYKRISDPSSPPPEIQRDPIAQPRAALFYSYSSTSSSLLSQVLPTFASTPGSPPLILRCHWETLFVRIANCSQDISFATGVSRQTNIRGTKHQFDSLLFLHNALFLVYIEPLRVLGGR